MSDIISGLILIFALLTFPFLWRRLFPILTRQKATRESAASLKITVEDVHEGAPTFSSTHDAMTFNDEEPPVRYSLKRPEQTGTHWSFLQRVDDGNTSYPTTWQLIEGVREPENWYLVVETGAISYVLKEALSKIAKEWTEQYLEFEGCPAEVHAYWYEGGGVKAANQIHSYLQMIIDAERTKANT
jgi:hypothetical protein